MTSSGTARMMTVLGADGPARNRSPPLCCFMDNSLGHGTFGLSITKRLAHDGKALGRCISGRYWKDA